MTEKLIEIDNLKKLYETEICQIVVFGIFEYGRRIKRALNGFGIEVSYYADNNKTVHNLYRDGVKIITPEEIKRLTNPVVIIGSFWFAAITRQLRQLGLMKIYALLECPVNTCEEIAKDRVELQEYFNHYQRYVSSKVLVEIYGHIGDVFVKTGICKALIQEYGKENVYFLVDNSEKCNIGLFLSLLSPNIIDLEKDRFEKDRDYRMEKLIFLNSQYFKFSYSLCDMRFHLKMRYINKFLLNVEKIYYAPEEYYVVEKDYKLLDHILGRDIRVWCQENNNITEEIKSVLLNVKLPERFVAVGMGAANSLRKYPYEKFEKVLNYLIRKGYKVVLLGYGSKDEDYYKATIMSKDYEDAVINLTSQLTLLESLAVINRCTYYVGVDSGMWHGSFILNKKSVVIYGKGDWGHFKHDNGNIHYAVSLQERCQDCRYWDCPQGSTINGMARCVESIEPDEIINKIRELEDTL